MGYKYSQLDKNNLEWFVNDTSCASLHTIHLKTGRLRGLGQFRLDLEYPISAIAGENGSGKSTILALAACAFHNRKSGYKMGDRKTSYYTFSDFFIQSREEIPPQGIEINYQILHNKWNKRNPGLAWQTRRKKEGGKWNDYHSRVYREVIYFGVQRVVPHYERSAHKSYRKRFLPGDFNADTLSRIASIAGKIFDRTYQGIELHSHSKYTLPIAQCNGVKYSGFNMGAGECAVFEILGALFQAGRGALLIIDEIELGLHEKAQRNLINELKLLSKELHCQVICSTHSPVILESLPPQARFFVSGALASTTITPGISSEYACGKLGGYNSNELDIFVEDGVAKHILQLGLPLSTRERVNIIPIGSSEAVLRQLTSRYLEGRTNCLAILDGDKKTENSSSLTKIANYSEASKQEEKDQIKQWSENRLAYLPGDTWPEKWLIDFAKSAMNSAQEQTSLMSDWGLDDDSHVSSLLEAGSRAEKHSEFYVIGSQLELDEKTVRADVIKYVKREDANFISNLADSIASLFEEGL